MSSRIEDPSNSHVEGNMKTIIALGLGVAVFISLGALVPWTGTTALVVTILGKWGAFSYKGLAGFFAAGILHGRL